jgi:Tfp pilus assembly protein PilX
VKKTHKSRQLPMRNQGFALVVTLSLMILLTIIAVGLLSLSSIALRSTSGSSAMSEARQNARLALMLALGELQEHAGQDQRITATADIAGLADGSLLADGAQPANDKTVTGATKGLSSVQPGTRHWTGVWRNSTLTAAGATTPATDIFTKTPAPTHLQWLVSGNDSGVNPAITPAATAYSVQASGSVADPATAVVLAGPQSVGAASPTTIQDYVTAPLVAISTNKSGSIKSTGRYAWWIGDEGVKAKFNRSAPAPATQTATYETLANQRAGWEVVTGLQNYPTPDNGPHEMLSRVVTLPQGEVLDPSLATTTGDTRALFHSATTDSFGVIADVLQGGLRVDLSATLAQGMPASSPSTFPNAPAKNKNIIPTTVTAARRMKGPKWDLISAFYNQAKSISGDKLTVKPATNDTDLAIAPIIVDLRLLMGVKIIAVDTSQYRLNPCGKIAVSLANPYPYTLEWNSDLELRMIDETPTQNNRSSRVWDAAGNCAFFGNKGEPAVFNNATFVIPKGDLAPGEARAYTMAAPVNRPASPSSIKVDLKPFSSSSPSNFANCIVQEEPANNTGSKLLDVRESWTTTQVTAELRLAGGSGNRILRRLERFELDNGFFGDLRRSVTRQTAESMKQPFPMHLYSFQLSQPGADYGTLLPSRDLLGTRSSTLRTFMDFNLRATRFSKPITSYNPPPYFMQSADSLASLPFNPPGGDTGSAFTQNLAISPLYWGRAPNIGVKKTVLFSLPKTFTSLAQLQHVDLTADDQFVSISKQPGYAVGNSYATPFVRRRLTIQSREDYIVTGVNGGESSSSTKTTNNYYDLSYLLNAALWDTCFFSSIDGTSGSEPLNQSIVVLDKSATGSLTDPNTASSHLMINGAFNINSTNKDAWKALLAGNRFLKHPADAAAGASSDALFPRSLEQTSPGLSSPTGTADDSFSGFRRLSNQQIDAVAEQIVKQVRMRGPFLSLSHFVNRALVDLTTRNAAINPLSRSGALQSALDNSGVNISPDGKMSAFSKSLNVTTDKVLLQADPNRAPKADLWGTQSNGSRGTTYGGTSDDGSPVWASQSKDLNPGSVASIVADRIMVTDNNMKIEQGFRSTGIPGWITQADVLQAIGPSIAVRSDTFRIRAYGEALGPDGKIVIARAWCEAIVQRVPGYVDPSNAPSERMASASDSAITTTNQKFGRKFEITSFRWLAQNEI